MSYTVYGQPRVWMQSPCIISLWHVVASVPLVTSFTYSHASGVGEADGEADGAEDGALDGAVDGAVDGEAVAVFDKHALDCTMQKLNPEFS